MKTILLCLFVFSFNAHSQSLTKPDPNSSINAEEQVNGLPAGKGAYSVRTKKRSVKVPAVIAPAENTTPANCADSLGGSGGANFTACEAGKRTR